MKKKRIFYGYWVLAVAFFCLVLMAGCIMYPFSLYVIPLTREFGWNRTSIMLASTIVTLSMALTSPLVGRILRRYGARRIITGGAVSLTVCFLLLSRLQHLWQLYILYAMAGVSAGAMGIIPATTVVANWFKRRRGFAIGILGTGIGVGGAALPLVIGTLILPDYGLRGAFIFSAVFASILIPLALLVIRTYPEEKGLLPDGDAVVTSQEKNSDPPVESGIFLKAAIRTPAFWLIALAFFAFNVANQSLMQNHVPYLQDYDFPAAVTATAIALVGIGSGIGKFFFGWLADFIHAKYTLVIGILFQVGAVLVLLNMGANSPIQLVWLYAIMLGLGIGCWLPALSLTTSAVFGLRDYSSIFGTLNMLFMFGASIGPVLAGRIYDLYGSYFWMFISALAFYAVSLPTILLVKSLRKD
ncbi:MAG: MFS transporter [Chloroflexota bacterium]